MIGDNNPPTMIEMAMDVIYSVNEWMKDHPVVQDEETARAAKLQTDRLKLCAKDLEAERERTVKPLNARVQEINGIYKPPRTLLQKVLDEVNSRITSFIAKEEAIRIKAAEEARKEAEEKERLAREAEQRERDTIADAQVGAIVDVAGSSNEADRTFAEYQRAERQAAIAERDRKVKIGGGFTRALGLKNKETLILDDAITAINAIGITKDVEEAILKGARSFRSMHGELPDGVHSEIERKI